MDTWLAAKWPTAVARQETYAGNHDGRYWQGLITHTVIPPHTTLAFVDTLADRLLTTPTDQVGANWLQALSGLNLDTDLFAAALIIDVYDGPLGTGWQATVIASYNGTYYWRRQAVGPEAADRNFSWQIANI